MASVKLNRSGLLGGGFRFAPGRLDATNITLERYIWTAFGIQPYQIEGLPDWAKTLRYDVVAKMPDGEDAGQTQAIQYRRLLTCLQGLLAGEVELKFHRGKKMVPGYALEIAKCGLKLYPADPNEPHHGTLDQGSGSSLSTKMIDGKPVNKYWNYSIAQLVNTLSNLLGREVVDHTGIAGRYNYTLNMSIAVETVAAGTEPADIGDSVFTSLQDAGLKLQSEKIEQEVLIIDSVIMRPTDR